VRFEDKQGGEKWLSLAKERCAIESVVAKARAEDARAASEAASVEPGAVQVLVKCNTTCPVWVQPDDSEEVVKAKVQCQCAELPSNVSFRLGRAGGLRLPDSWRVTKSSLFLTVNEVGLLGGAPGGGASAEQRKRPREEQHNKSAAEVEVQPSNLTLTLTLTLILTLTLTLTLT